jgi:hypothetical protein
VKIQRAESDNEALMMDQTVIQLDNEKKKCLGVEKRKAKE